jgi:pyridoxamine 5'-phosphate oxidase
MNQLSLADIRKEYSLKELDLESVVPDPHEQFHIWLQEAIASSVMEVNAMNLSTVSAAGRPDGRIVLLKGLENGKFIFFTNYASKKGEELMANPFAHLTFFWPELERQVRISGSCSKCSPEVSDAYYESRPIGSRIGAVASPQSKVISSRKVLEERVKEIIVTLGGNQPKRPDSWGGYEVKADSIEFWQGRPSRLHDRILYTLTEGAKWKIDRLAP